MDEPYVLELMSEVGMWREVPYRSIEAVLGNSTYLSMHFDNEESNSATVEYDDLNVRIRVIDPVRTLLELASLNMNEAEFLLGVVRGDILAPNSILPLTHFNVIFMVAIRQVACLALQKSRSNGQN